MTSSFVVHSMQWQPAQQKKVAQLEAKEAKDRLMSPDDSSHPITANYLSKMHRTPCCSLGTQKKSLTWALPFHLSLIVLHDSSCYFATPLVMITRRCICYSLMCILKLCVCFYKYAGEIVVNVRE